MKGFIEFIRTQGIVGLAIGFILGGALSAMVKSLIDNVVNPIVGLLLGKAAALSDFSVTVGSATVAYGRFLSDLINFIVMAAVVYFVVQGLRFNKLDKPKA